MERKLNGKRIAILVGNTPVQHSRFLQPDLQFPDLLPCGQRKQAPGRFGTMLLFFLVSGRRPCSPPNLTRWPGFWADGA